MPDRRPVKILHSFDAGACEHRLTVCSCYSCGFRPPLDPDMWLKAMTAFVVCPVRGKLECAAYVSECPQCFVSSWCHYPIDAIKLWRDWPRECVEAAKLEIQRRIKHHPYLADRLDLLDD